MKIKTARREAKESVYWLGLVIVYDNNDLESTRNSLIDEGKQITKILSSILIKLNS